MPAAPESSRQTPPTGPIGQIRSTGTTILLFVMTLGIGGFVYFYQTHEEMKRHSGEGLGGASARVLTIFAGVVSPFVYSQEAGNLDERMGRFRPVSARTGPWYVPGIVILVGPLIWFVRVTTP